MTGRYNFDDEESGDDSFNPNDGLDSDAEDAEMSARANQKHRSADQDRSRREVQEDYDDEDEGDTGAAQGNGHDVEANADEDVDADDHGDEDDEGDDDDDEDDDDEEEVFGAPSRKRRKKDKRNQFIDVEAEVDDEDDEDIEDLDDDVQEDTHPDDFDDIRPGAEADGRHRDLDRQRELEASMDAEKQAAELRKKYGRNRTAALDTVVIDQRLLLPSINDPTVWGIKCREGKEREVIFSILKRCEDRRKGRNPLQISSAFQRDTMKGWIYVEAFKLGDAMEAVEGISNCYPRAKPPVLVPLNERPDLLRVNKTKTLEPGAYVRIKRGRYAGDLALVEEVENTGLEVTLKIVPRLSYGLNEDVNVAPSEAKRKRANVPAVQPPQRLFNETEAKKKHMKFLQQISTIGRRQWNYMNETYIDGFLIKDFKLQHLQTEDVNPTLEEVTKFAAGAEDGTEALDLAAIAATLKEGSLASEFVPGDMVEVYQGEQRGLSGKAISVHGQIVTIQVTEGEMKGQTVEAPVKSLRKKFREGDHVKVIGGSKYRDEVGMVVRIKDDRVSLITDSTNQEITVFSKDLREATDSGGPLGSSKYDLHDLVSLDASTVACIIKVDRESFRVLDQNGSVKTLLPSQIAGRIDRKRFAVATDREGAEVRHDDTVKEYSGEGRAGRVLHIHRNYLFLQNRQMTENGGIFVVRSTNVTTVAAKGGRVNNAGPDLTKMNPALQRNGGTNGPMAPPPKTFGRDKLIGKTVTVRKGPHKGMMGIVKDTTDSEARVELHAKNKIITIPKEILTIKDPITGQSVSFGGNRRPGGAQNQTPARAPDSWQGGRTPAAGARTPAWGMQSGARTTGWGSGQGGRTPAWSSRTPAWAGGDGGRTSYGGATSYGGSTSYGGNTAYGGSTWNPNSRTPYNAGHGFSEGSKTPAWGAAPQSYSGSRTPAPNYSGSHSTSYQPQNSHPAAAPTPAFDAPTPAFNAPTPAANPRYDAPTPAFNAPTPGDSGVYGGPTPRPPYGGYGQTPAAAPTPGPWTAETPMAWNAETPAAVGGDDDPRYE